MHLTDSAPPLLGLPLTPPPHTHTLIAVCPPQVYMSEVAILTDYKLDESYTPTKISVRVGNNFSDLREVRAGACGRAGGGGGRRAAEEMQWQTLRGGAGAERRWACEAGPQWACPTTVHRWAPAACLPTSRCCCCCCCPALQVRCIELLEPQGWVVVSLTPEDQPE